MENQIPVSPVQIPVAVQKPWQEKVGLFILFLVGFFYSGYFLFSTIIFVLFSCFFGCNDFSPVRQTEGYINFILLLITLVTFIFLVRKKLWASVIMITLGIIIISNFFFSFYTTDASLKDTLTSSAFWVSSVPLILMILYLLITGSTKKWFRDYKTIILAIIISGFALGLQFYNIQDQHINLQPTYIRENFAGQASDYIKKIPAGETYKNTEFGFEITFPWAINVDELNPPDVVIDRSIPNYKPNGNYSIDEEHVDEFEIYADKRSSVGTIDQAYKTDLNYKYPNVTFTEGNFNNLPFIKRVDSFPGGGGHIQYTFIHDNSYVTVDVKGTDQQLQQYEEIMKTFQFF